MITRRKDPADVAQAILDPETIRSYLAVCNADSESCYVSERLIGFSTAQEQANNLGVYMKGSNFEAGRYIDVFSNLFKISHGGKKSTVAAFAIWTKTWVGDHSAWMERPWHAWGAAIIGDRTKTLVIYDCDLTEFGSEAGNRFRSLDVQKQAVFIRYATKQRKSIRTVFYSQDDSNDGQSKCLAHTLRWVKSISEMTDEQLQETDWAAYGFIELKR
jgi:hypothetical protein